MKPLTLLLSLALLSLGLALPQIAGAQEPVGRRTVPVGEGAVPVGEEAVPVGEHAVPVGEGTVSVGEGAHYTSLNDARFSALQKALNHPDTKPLYEGLLDERFAGLKKRFISVVKKAGNPSAADKAAMKAQVAHDSAWGDAARAAAGPQTGKLFDKAWWSANKGQFVDPRFYRTQDEAADWNKRTDWKTLAKMLKIGPNPFYFDYGRNIAFKSDVIYVNHQKICGHRDAVGSARRLAGTPIPVKGEQIHWKPLGTFILSQNAKTQKIEIAMQLVCGDQGTISGSYYDWRTKHTEPLIGQVDFDTQRVAFKIKKSRIVMECGLANLTRDEARIWAHLPDGRSPVWLLARVK